MSKSRPNEFRVPSPGFSRVMGIWNTRDSVAAVTGISDIARIGKTPPARIHQRNSRKKALLRPQESASERNKRSSVQKWNAILTTTTQIVRANRQLRLKANRVRLQNIAAKKLKSMGDYAPPVHPKTAEDVELIQQALGNKFVFDELTPDELKPFVDAFCKVNFQKGDVLFQQGDPGKHFYIVCQGQIEFNVGEKQVGIATRGASFGEVALLYTCPQAATTTVKENDACVFRVGQMCFRSILKLRTQRIDDEKAKLLEAMDCFEDVGKDDLRRLGEALVAVVYQEGDVLYSDEDDSGPPFCVVQEGQLKVADINLGGTKYDQMTLNEGDHCGDLKSMSMDLTDLVDSAYGTVTAVSKGLVYTIDRPTFQKVFGDVSRLVIKSLDKKKLAATPMIRRANLDDDSLDKLALNIADKMYEANCQVFSLDKDTDAAFYLVREGCIKLIRKDGSGTIISAGGYFGQEQLLVDCNRCSCRPDHSVCTRVPAEYTATAVEKSLLGVLSLDDCRHVFDTRILGTKTNVGQADDPLEYKGITTVAELEELKRHYCLGDGHFAEVWLVTNTVDEEGQVMALKIQVKEEVDYDAIQAEISVMQDLHYPFVVNFIRSYEDEQFCYILMPAFPGGELFDIIYQDGGNGEVVSGLAEPQGQFYSAVVSDALAYLHRQNILYRDLKPENVLIDADGYPILIDFGLAKKLDKEDKTFTLCGTPQCTAPEIIMNRGHGLSSDNWSLGVLIYTLLEGANPFYFDGMDQTTLFNVVCKENPYPMTEGVSSQAKNLVHRLLEKEPSQRLGSFRPKDVTMHEWFSDLCFSDLRRKRVKAPWVPAPLTFEE